MFKQILKAFGASIVIIIVVYSLLTGGRMLSYVLIYEDLVVATIKIEVREECLKP